VSPPGLGARKPRPGLPPCPVITRQSWPGISRWEMRRLN
jgi:hypothetical protein